MSPLEFLFIEDPHLPTLVSTSSQNVESNSFYDGRTLAYDDYLHLTFDTHGVDEWQLRRSLAQRLNPGGKVILELGAGTGRDSLIFLQEFNDVQLILLEPAPKMLEVAKSKILAAGKSALALQSPAHEITLPDQSVEGIYSFGGFNEFAEKDKVLSEIVRVSKPGARVLISDEGIPQWWRETDFFRVLHHTNPQFSGKPPLDLLPQEVRNVHLNWEVGETFWVLYFEIGRGQPSGFFDIPIPGKRGGTLNSRFYGKVEGVSRETRSAISAFLDSSNLSEHEVVETALRNYLCLDGDSAPQQITE